MSKSTSRRTKASGKLFQVFADEGEVPAAPKAPSSRRPLKDKENALKTTRSSKPPLPFGGKTLFEAASPVKPGEQTWQPLGFFAPDSPCKPTLSATSGNAPRLGDPTKRKSRPKQLQRIAVDEELKWPAQTPVSPVLANVTEAYSGQNGFGFSAATDQESSCTPMRPYGRPFKRSAMSIDGTPASLPLSCQDVDQTPRLVFAPSVEQHADSPCASTVLPCGSPIKRSAVMAEKPVPLRI